MVVGGSRPSDQSIVITSQFYRRTFAAWIAQW
ncbi:unnamed protein product [Schistosoma margrebowiei]|uniref:Uncharacterized protein n=1 Tax=Schistosoma margrebowiei TaxID=48269 RepID=A0A183MZK0_9TREM|nr:unnamed protein product [Schistosoma margrebowiei]